MNAEDFQMPEPEEEHPPHLDERWLVSYSDMMTLLFGLFVLLYSMYDRFDVIQDSVENKFGVEEETPAKPVETAPAVDETAKHDIDKIKTQTAEMQRKYLAAQSELEKVQSILKETEQANRKLSAKLQAAADDNERERADMRRQAAQAAQSAPAAPAAPATPSANTKPFNGDERPARIMGDKRGGGGGGQKTYHVRAKMPDGSMLEDDIYQVWPKSMTLSHPPPLTFSEKFLLEISNNGESVEVMVRPLYDETTRNISGHLEILGFPNRDGNVYENWFKRH